MKSKSLISLTLLEETFTIHRLDPDSVLLPDVYHNSFLSVTRTQDELSLVLPEYVEITSDKVETGWACFKVAGPLDFGQVGILSALTGVLAKAGVPVFALSTFDTDYILVKREQVEAAVEALTSAGHPVTKEIT